MAESSKPFVVTDRRKFTLEGELRPEAEREHNEPERRPEATPSPVAAAPEPAPISQPVTTPAALEESPELEGEGLPGPTAEQVERSRMAYEATADRLDTAMRAANPGGERLPPASFDQLVQSLYMTALMQLGGGTPEGERAQVDILGARQSIDMMAVLADKTRGNLAADETRLLESAVFELRMAFLEITQALARSAAAKGPGPEGGRPSIVR